MAGRLTLHGASELLRTFFGRTSEPPASFWLALIRSIAPTPYVSGSELDEPSTDDGYARIELPNDVVNWGNADAGLLHIVSNQQTVSFMSALNNGWGRISYWALCSNDIEGQVYMVGQIEEDLFVAGGDVVSLGDGDLVIELGPFFSDGDF